MKELSLIHILNRNRQFGSLCSEAHYDAARKIAAEGIVLLQNKGRVLPIDISALLNH